MNDSFKFRLIDALIEIKITSLNEIGINLLAIWWLGFINPHLPSGVSNAS